MRRALIVIAVLGSGTALSFLAAGAIFLADPSGHLVTSNGSGAGIDRGGGIIGPVPGKDLQIPGPVAVPAGGEKGFVGQESAVVPPPDAVVSAPIVTTIDVAPGRLRILPPQSGTQP